MIQNFPSYGEWIDGFKNYKNFYHYYDLSSIEVKKESDEDVYYFWEMRDFYETQPLEVKSAISYKKINCKKNLLTILWMDTFSEQLGKGKKWGFNPQRTIENLKETDLNNYEAFCSTFIKNETLKDKVKRIIKTKKYDM